MLNELRSGQLFSARRLYVFGLAFLVSLFDMLYLHVFGIETFSELAAQTFVHGLGLYLGLTVGAIFGTDVRF